MCIFATQIPIYNFKQPGRLNPDQLPFSIVRVKSIDMTGLHIIPVDPISASDSWFPGYACEFNAKSFSPDRPTFRISPILLKICSKHVTQW